MMLSHTRQTAPRSPPTPYGVLERGSKLRVPFERRKAEGSREKDRRDRILRRGDRGVVEIEATGSTAMAKPSLKRGESGKSNAASIAFRYGGKPCNYGIVTGNPTFSPRGAGSLLVQAMSLGAILPGFDPSENLLRKTDAAMEKCTSPWLT